MASFGGPSGEITLAQRLGRTSHVSALRIKLCRLWKSSANPPAVLEDWLVDVANARGARIVTRGTKATAPENSYRRALTNEELTVALLLPQNLDRPQMLRLAAQLVSRQAVDFKELVRVAVHERVGFVLAELARQACKVEPQHPLWKRLQSEFQHERVPASSLLHYSRLADPVIKNGAGNAEKWILVA